MRILELFSGYGSQALALENLGIEFTSDISEIDKYAIQAYNQLHGETHNWGDITKIDETKLPYYDLITYSSPCQDFSVAGLQKGGDLGSGTRSSLLWECERIIRAVKPKYLLMENVKNLVGEKHKHNFIRWLRVLENMGYQNFWKVQNAKDYGVPQNRERVFVVSILGCGQYLFPNPIKLEKRLKDVLEENVDEKYYLSDKLIQGFLAKQARGDTFATRGINVREKDSYASTLTARMWKMGITDNYIEEPIALDEQNNCVRKDGTVGTLTTDRSSPKHNNRVIEPICVASRGRENGQELEVQTEPVTNTITSVQKDNYIVEPRVIGGIGEKSFGKQYRQGNRIYSSDAISPTLQANNGNASGGSVLINEPNVLTPKRTEYGKQIRKEYESGTVKESRHNMTELEPRQDGISNTLTSVQKDNMLLEPTVQQIGNIVHTGNWNNPERGRIYSANGVSPALSTMQGGGLEPKIITEWNYMNSSHNASRIVNKEGISPTVMENHGTVTAVKQNYRIRKLTPRECWRLMGVKDEQFNKLHGISNSQLYKLAGNSIVVDVLMGIFKNLLQSDEGTKGQLTLL